MIKLNSRVLINDDKLVVLTPRQASTLRALALCSPGMVAEDMLLKATMRQSAYKGGRTTVEQRMKSLRRALREVGSPGRLFRVNGGDRIYGYRLGDEIEVVE